MSPALVYKWWTCTFFKFTGLCTLIISHPPLVSAVDHRIRCRPLQICSGFLWSEMALSAQVPWEVSHCRCFLVRSSGGSAQVGVRGLHVASLKSCLIQRDMFTSTAGSVTTCSLFSLFKNTSVPIIARLRGIPRSSQSVPLLWSQ